MGARSKIVDQALSDISIVEDLGHGCGKPGVCPMCAAIILSEEVRRMRIRLRQILEA